MELFAKICGTFELLYEDEWYKGFKGSGKSNLILQYIILQHPKRVSKEELVKLLFDNEDLRSPNDNFKVYMYRLRQKLSLLMKEKDVIDYTNEGYGISSKIQLSRDIDVFHEYLENIQEDIEEQQLYLALSQLQGELLPQLHELGFVAYMNQQIKEQRIKAVARLFELQSLDWALYPVLCSLQEDYPYEESIYGYKLRLLLHFKQYRQAREFYEWTRDYFLNELGIYELKELEAIWNKEYPPASEGVELKQLLKREHHKRCCSYLTFHEHYQLIMSLAERMNLSIYILSITINSNLDKASKGKLKLTLYTYLNTKLEQGDIFTFMPPNQYIALISSASDLILSTFEEELNERLPKSLQNKKNAICLRLVSRTKNYA